MPTPRKKPASRPSTTEPTKRARKAPGADTPGSPSGVEPAAARRKRAAAGGNGDGAPAGPEDVLGRAFVRLGAHLERFLAPVEPGNLMLLSYKDDVPIVSAPCCFRSAKPNVLDMILPPILARYRISGWEIACLGHGGLLS